MTTKQIWISFAEDIEPDFVFKTEIQFSFNIPSCIISPAHHRELNLVIHSLASSVSQFLHSMTKLNYLCFAISLHIMNIYLNTFCPECSFSYLPSSES